MKTANGFVNLNYELGDERVKFSRKTKDTQALSEKWIKGLMNIKDHNTGRSQEISAYGEIS
ncbi:hypothetical protein BK009_00025 [Methanobacterium subterraneum]|uniref:Uncharacterized protein n=1 Tax=Methanobacterium subterraneum TaxID=59277 RepID=A0A2H4VM86_9EURY|nr:hypothetical protein BK009_00025 [Methanobacterium subterraneum]